MHRAAAEQQLRGRANLSILHDATRAARAAITGAVAFENRRRHAVESLLCEPTQVVRHDVGCVNTERAYEPKRAKFRSCWWKAVVGSQPAPAAKSGAVAGGKP